MLRGSEEGRSLRLINTPPGKPQKEGQVLSASVREKKYRERLLTIKEAVSMLRRRERNDLRTKYDDALLEKMEAFKPNAMKIVEVGTRSIGGIARALGGALLRGNIGPFAIPLVYTIGVKSDVSSLLKTIDYWGEARLTLEKKKQGVWNDARSDLQTFKNGEYSQEVRHTAVIRTIQHLRKKESGILAQHTFFRKMKSIPGLERNFQKRVTVLLTDSVSLRDSEVAHHLVRAITLISKKISSVQKNNVPAYAAALIDLARVANTELREIFQGKTPAEHGLRRVDVFNSFPEREKKREENQRRLEAHEDTLRRKKKITGPRVVDRKIFIIADPPQEYIPSSTVDIPELHIDIASSKKRNEHSFTPVTKEIAAPIMDPLLKRSEEIRQELATLSGMTRDEVRSPKKFEKAFQGWSERAEFYQIPPVMNMILDGIETCEQAKRDGARLSFHTLTALYSRLYGFLEKQLAAKTVGIPIQKEVLKEQSLKQSEGNAFVSLGHLRQDMIVIPALRKERVKVSRIGEISPAEQDIARSIGVDVNVAEDTESLRKAIIQWIPHANKQQLQDVSLKMSGILGVISNIMEAPSWGTNNLLKKKRDSYEILLKEIEIYFL